MKTLFKLTIAGLVVLVALAVGVFGYGYYQVLSFDTETLPARHGQVRTELFLGEGDHQTLIVGLGGSEGGNAWASDRWAEQRRRLNELGYAFLAVGYFGMEGTPADLDRISLDAIHEAARRATDHPRVMDGCYAVVGGSRGAEAALLLGSRFSDVAAVVAIVPSSAVFPALNMAMTTPGFSLGDRPLPFVPVPWRATPELLTGDMRGAFEEMMRDEQAMADAAIPVEFINGPVLFLSATRDEVWPSAEMAEAMMQRLQAAGFRHPAAHIAIEGNHAAPLAHLDRMEAFLSEHVPADGVAGCAGTGDQVASVDGAPGAKTPAPGEAPGTPALQ